MKEPDDKEAVGTRFLIGNSNIGEIGQEHRDLIEELRDLAPVETAAAFGSLLAFPELQANCIRLEALVHLAMSYCAGRTSPTAQFVSRAFERLGEGYCGKMEDPAEDVFLGLVNTTRGNFRIFEGVGEGASFYLQRILNVTEGMPNVEPFVRIRNSIECLLKLSDAVAERLRVHENCLGNEMPLDALPEQVADRLPLSRAHVRFCDDDLTVMKIPKKLLSDFIFDADERYWLCDSTMGNTNLERRPLVSDEEGIHLLLPTAIAPAITRFVVELITSMDLGHTLERALCDEYSRLFNETRILGKQLGGPIQFQRIPGGRIAALMTEADPGRFLDLVFFVDGLDGFLSEGFNGTNAEPDSLSKALRGHVRAASAEAAEYPHFRDGITLLVGCGFGRGLAIEAEGDLPPRWRLEAIAAHDLVTLNWLSGFDSLSVWKLLDSRDAIKREGAALLNVNGLLNLVAWSRELGGHLVPHGELSDGFVGKGPESVVVVRQNANRELRDRVLTQWSPRRVLDPEGNWVKVRKLDKGVFDEDEGTPLYGSEEDAREGLLRGVYVGAKRSWWIQIAAPENASRNGIFQHWMMLCVWLKNAAPILDEAYPLLRTGPISFNVRFAEITLTTESDVKPLGLEVLRRLVQVSAEPSSAFIQIAVSEHFEDGFAQPENFAEYVLVEALVLGASVASGEPDDAGKRADLVAKICPNSQARWLHRTRARVFRDSVGSSIEAEPILIDPLDDAASRIGLGWRARSRGSGPRISGISECTSFLNRTVQSILADFCAALKRLDRRSLVNAALESLEAAAYDRDVWRRTTRANIAIRTDKKAARRTIVEHHSRLNACFLSSRILLEAAICECPLEGGAAAGRLDLSRLLSQAAQSYFLGGWSDAIHWGAMEPSLRITPLGDIHSKLSFVEGVYEPFGQEVAEGEAIRAEASYPDLYTSPNVLTSVADLIEGQFLIAWESEFGTSVDGLRAFMEQLEDSCRLPPRAYRDLPRSVLIEMLAASAGIPSENARFTVNLLTLEPRPEWRVATSEFTGKDWFPWRFRRRLSVLRKPLIQTDDGVDPTIVFAPGMVREAIHLTMSLFHSGGLPASQARSPEMRAWIGHANHTQRTEFNSKVELRMRELGWQTDKEVRLTKILGRPLDRDYGDTDVLAWSPASGRVLLMECKDLQFNKTLGEVAEQLADFRGETRPDGEADDLKKHLDRVEVLMAYEPEVARWLNIRVPIQLEAHLLFKNPVPMKFAWEKMVSRIRLSLFDQLDQI